MLHSKPNSIKSHFLLGLVQRVLFFLNTLFILLFPSCSNKENSLNCTTLPSSLIQISVNDSFEFGSDTSILVDINQDGITDFEFLSQPAGNRFNPFIQGSLLENKIRIPTEKDQIFLNSGDAIKSTDVFVNQFNFSDLGNGQAAHFNDKFLGVQFTVNNATHFGWIKLSSTTNEGESSSTPIYYLKVSMELMEVGYNESCDKSLILP